MSKKTRNLTNKAGKLMKCDGQMLKKVIEAKGYKCHELSKMLRYCSDYLTTCCRTNKISDIAALYLMDYKIFPKMYGLEDVIKVDEPKEVKIDKDDNLKKIAEKTIDRDSIYGPKRPEGAPDDVICDIPDTDDALSHCLKKRMDMINRNSTYGIPKPDKEVEFGTPFGVVRSEKDLRNCIKQATPKTLLWGSNLVKVRDILETACDNGLKYNVEDMRNDLLVYATKVANPECWVRFVERLNLVNDPTVQEIKRVLNEKYGKLEKGVEGIDRGYGPAPKNPSYYAAGHTIAKGLFQLMQTAMNDLKHDPEFKELIKQAVKEAYEEL